MTAELFQSMEGSMLSTEDTDEILRMLKVLGDEYRKVGNYKAVAVSACSLPQDEGRID